MASVSTTADFWPRLGQAVGGLPGTVRVVVVRFGDVTAQWPAPGGSAESATVAAIGEVLRQPANVSVAVLDGDVDGVALQLALACDLVLATQTTTLAVSDSEDDPSRLAGIGRLVELVGRARAAALFLAGDRLPATDPGVAGLFWRVCPPPDLAATLEALLDRLLARGRSSSVETKALLNSALEYSRAEQEAAETQAADRIRAELRGDVAEDSADVQAR